MVIAVACTLRKTMVPTIVFRNLIDMGVRKFGRSAVQQYFLQVDQFVELIMGELNKLVDGSETYSPTLKLLQRDLGTQVYQK